MSGAALLRHLPEPTPHVTERLRMFSAILSGQAASRRDLSDQFALRSTSVSEHVGHLVAVGLVVESLRHSSGRGRPSAVLVANPHRLAAIVYQVESQAIAVSCVNLAGQVLARIAREVPPEADNHLMRDLLASLFAAVSARLPDPTEIAGVSFSLSGVLDAARRRWLFSSRWPNLRAFDAAEAVSAAGLPVYVARNLDLELSARLAHTSDVSGGTLLVHWGWGIGAAYAVDGMPVNGAEGRFGEIGHWRVVDRGGPCRCGRHGCLETVAAHWALSPRLAERWQVKANEEQAAAAVLRDLDLLAEPAFAEALDAMVIAVGNLCRVLFPRRIIVSGPFIDNARVWSSFRERLAREGGMPGVAPPEVTADQRSRELEREGAAAAPLRAGLQRLLNQGM
ncbi:ROK family protein [Chelatococcus sp. GCM10030263]|uniref:ROK family transcriptional regulator n=1 Tax=Chelatococcus sp. GCM10030263 TaxID=3273387 RepID=UPI0036117793